VPGGCFPRTIQITLTGMETWQQGDGTADASLLDGAVLTAAAYDIREPERFGDNPDSAPGRRTGVVSPEAGDACPPELLQPNAR
jgi:hypothetical protein